MTTLRWRSCYTPILIAVLYNSRFDLERGRLLGSWDKKLFFCMVMSHLCDNGYPTSGIWMGVCRILVLWRDTLGNQAAEKKSIQGIYLFLSMYLFW
jgi:hypothetical protein